MNTDSNCRKNSKQINKSAPDRGNYSSYTKILLTTRLLQSREHFICSCQIFKLCFWKGFLENDVKSLSHSFFQEQNLSLSFFFCMRYRRVWSSFFSFLSIALRLQWAAMTKVYLLHLRLRRNPVAKGSLRNLSYSASWKKTETHILKAWVYAVQALKSQDTVWQPCERVAEKAM